MHNHFAYTCIILLRLHIFFAYMQYPFAPLHYHFACVLLFCTFVRSYRSALAARPHCFTIAPGMHSTHNRKYDVRDVKRNHNDSLAARDAEFAD